ncbi:hypothetical protein SAZ_39570 [Streptomyces noursei ZPM]|nr:hypothetical protein SAZ_39570 [Streptomyces noursei ZPM]EPY93265.1 hypothetical protein K530_48970 [Streptomyces noursei CCRC 11814]
MVLLVLLVVCGIAFAAAAVAGAPIARAKLAAALIANIRRDFCG